MYWSLRRGGPSVQIRGPLGREEAPHTDQWPSIRRGGPYIDQMPSRKRPLRNRSPIRSIGSTLYRSKDLYVDSRPPVQIRDPLQKEILCIDQRFSREKGGPCRDRRPSKRSDSPYRLGREETF